MKRMLLVTLGTSVLSALVISNAYAKKRQFYSTIVYLLNSNRTLGVSVLIIENVCRSSTFYT